MNLQGLNASFGRKSQVSKAMMMMGMMMGITIMMLPENLARECLTDFGFLLRSFLGKRKSFCFNTSWCERLHSGSRFFSKGKMQWRTRKNIKCTNVDPLLMVLTSLNIESTLFPQRLRLQVGEIFHSFMDSYFTASNFLPVATSRWSIRAAKWGYL